MLPVHDPRHLTERTMATLQALWLCRGSDQTQRESLLVLDSVRFFNPCRYWENWQSCERPCKPSHDTLASGG